MLSIYYGKTEASALEEKKTEASTNAEKFLVGWGWVPQKGLPLPWEFSTSVGNQDTGKWKGSPRVNTTGAGGVPRREVSFPWNVQGSDTSTRHMCGEGKGHRHT